MSSPGHGARFTKDKKRPKLLDFRGMRAKAVAPSLPLSESMPAGGWSMAARNTHITRIALLTTIAWSFAVGALAQDRRDMRVADEISRAIRQYSRFTIFDDVNGRVDAGVVTLDGKVTMPYKKTDLERLVSKIDGVREVKSTIQTLPVSPYDDELRSRIARAIYGNPSFWNYAAMSQPPIHIIVDRGHVTLTGVVNSEVDRSLARSLATGNGEFSVANELRTDFAGASAGMTPQRQRR
jgi:osmotically-inducible protein OsmY